MFIGPGKSVPRGKRMEVDENTPRDCTGQKLQTSQLSILHTLGLFLHMRHASICKVQGIKMKTSAWCTYSIKPSPAHLLPQQGPSWMGILPRITHSILWLCLLGILHPCSSSFSDLDILEKSMPLISLVSPNVCLPYIPSWFDLGHTVLTGVSIKGHCVFPAHHIRRLSGWWCQ